MPETLPITPYVPQYITVHLGPPGSNAENVTVSFPDYVKNVASSEIYPTWETAALQANILAIISFALNRVYTEFYPSRGYPFNITSSTAYDQKFIKGRNIFENISQLVDEMFNSYIRRIGFVEPLAAKFCNGTTVIRNAGRLRLKESDRIAAMQEELAKFGAQVTAEGDTVSIRGGALHRPEVPLQGHNDHRIVMTLAVTALAAGQPAVIRGAEAVNKSWPDFFEALRALGAKIDTEPTA